jgi:hypothetical protein
MSVLAEVNELTTAWLVVSFYNRDDILEAPSTMVYEIWDVKSGTKVKDETSLTPDSEVEIVLSSDDNRILDQSNFREARKVIVTATYSGGGKFVQDFVYHVRNIAYKS